MKHKQIKKYRFVTAEICNTVHCMLLLMPPHSKRKEKEWNIPQLSNTCYVLPGDIPHRKQQPFVVRGSKFSSDITSKHKTQDIPNKESYLAHTKQFYIQQL
jgi:hypothetical protein